MHRAWKRLAVTTLGALIVMPVFGGPLRDAIVDRVLSRRIEAAQEELGEEPSEPVVVPAGTRVEKDLAYGDDPAQRLDVYRPASAGQGGKLAPVIFMVHGGAWMIGDKALANVVQNKIARWLPRGFVVVSPNYRMVPKASVLDEAHDVGRALAYAQAHAREWGGDPARVLLMGHSAGAHLVSLISADPDIALSQGARPWLGTVALDSASMNVVSTMQAKHFSFYDKVFGPDPSFWQQVSPYHRLQKTPLGPFLLVCSSKRSDSCPQAQAFADKVRSLGGRATVLPQDLSHGDINKRLGEPGDYTSGVEGFMGGLGLN